MARYVDVDALKLDIDLSKGASVVDMALSLIKAVKEAPEVDVVPKREVLRLQSFKALIKSRGLTQAELAAMVGCSQRAITHWISGRNLPTLKEAYLLAYVLGITLDELATIFLYGERKTTDGMSAPKER